MRLEMNLSVHIAILKHSQKRGEVNIIRICISVDVLCVLNVVEDIHHIKPQNLADESGYMSH